MDLSNDLISKFVKITNDADKKKSKEGTVYGTVVKYNGGIYVKIDGSDLLTPVDTTADIQDSERVTITIKDHNATVTGNITSPSANEGTVTKKVTEAVDGIEDKVITEVETLVADRVSTKELDAELARIDVLIAGKATIEDLTATNATIENLTAKNAEIENLVAEKATIKDLTATNATIGTLDAKVANIDTLVNGNLTSDNILSFNITSKNTTMEDAFIKDAMIDRITANKIMSGVIDTNNVVIQSTDGSMLLQGNILQMKDENGKVRIQIGKDTGGNFSFVLYDESGKGVLIDEEGIKSSDAIADGLIVDAKVADNANISGGKLDIASVITEVNKDNSTTIKSSKIYLDEQNQSLEVAFNSLKTQVETIQDVTIDGDLSSIVEQVQSNTTQIEANKEGINTLVAENVIRTEEISDLEGELQQVNTTLSNKYSSLEQNVNGFKTTVSDTYTTKSEFNNLELGGRNLLLKTNIEVTNNNYNIEGYKPTELFEADEKYTISVCITPASGVTHIVPYVSGGYRNITQNMQVNGTDKQVITATFTFMEYYPGRVPNDTSNGNAVVNIYRFPDNGTVTSNTTIHWVKLEKGDKATDWTPAPEDVQGQIDATNTNLQNNYSTTSVMNSAIQQKANEITSSVSQTYATKQSVTDVSNNLAANYSTTSAMNSAIQQKANEITSSVSQTYATKQSVTDVSNNLTTNYSTTSAMNSAIEQKTNEIASRVSSVESTSNTAVLLAKAMNNGKILHADPMFKSGYNNVGVYNNSANGTVTVTRIAKVSDCPTTSTHCIEVKTTGTASPNNGGIYQLIQSRANAIFIQKILAKVPTGCTLNAAANSMGTGYSDRWLTSNKGTGKWEEYIREIRCGSTGSFSTGGHVHISGANPTTSSPLVWYVGMCTTYDITDSDERITDLTTRVSTAESKLTKDSLTTTIGSHYTTSSDVNGLITAKGYATTSQVQQTADNLTATFKASGGYNYIRDSYINKSESTYGFYGGVIDASKLVPGKTYTLTLCGRKNASSNTGYPRAFIWYEGWVHNFSTGEIKTTTDSTSSVTFTMPSGTDPSKWAINLYHYPSGGTGTSYFKWVQLVEGSLEQPWSPHPSEIYDGVTRIDKDGIKVSQSNYKGYTQMSASGFYVNNGSENVISCTSSGLTVKGTINATAGTFSGNIVTNNIVKAYNSVYAGAEIWGGYKLNSSGAYVSSQTFKIHGSAAVQIDGNPTRISSVTGEVKIGDASSYDNLRAREIYAQEIIYTNDLRTRDSASLSLSNVSMRSANAFIEFSSGFGVLRVPEENHLYLQCGTVGNGSTNSEVRCTTYQMTKGYANLRAHNVCAQNAVFANGVNVSSDRARKRDIELYSTDALHEVCTTPVYTYHLDTDKDEELKRIGIIMQEAPLDAIDLTGKGVDLYQMVTMLWRAVQQQQEMIKELKGE